MTLSAPYSQISSDLQDVIRTVRKRLSTSKKPICTRRDPLSNIASPTFTFPPVKDIFDDLLSKNVSHRAAKEISKLYGVTLGNYQQQIRTIFAKTWSDLISLPRHERMLPLDKLGEELAETITSIYRAKERSLQDELYRFVASRLQVRPVGVKKLDSENERGTFNYVRIASI